MTGSPVWSSPSVVVVTGSDTGVGKTWTGAALARAAASRGARVVAIKPFETGCAEAIDDSEDGATLARASGQTTPLRALVRFASPVAAAEASDREGTAIDYDGVLAQIRELVIGADIALVEGAGGLLSPLSWDTTVLDLARDLRARILVVAADRLGTVNHTVMTLKLLEANGVRALGVVLTPPEKPDHSTGTNAKAIRRLSSARVHTVPRTVDLGASARSVEEVLTWLA